MKRAKLKKGDETPWRCTGDSPKSMEIGAWPHNEPVFLVSQFYMHSTKPLPEWQESVTVSQMANNLIFLIENGFWLA